MICSSGTLCAGGVLTHLVHFHRFIDFPRNPDLVLCFHLCFVSIPRLRFSDFWVARIVAG